MWRSSCVLVCATGCGLSEHVVTFAELAPAALLNDTGVLAFGPAAGGSWTDDCPVLPSTASATLDGIVEPTYVDLGGVYQGAGGGEGCERLAFIWTPPGPSTAGASTFVVTDETSTWTFVVWHPFAKRGFSLVSHPTGQIRAGDRVVAQSNIVEDGPLVPYLLVRVETFASQFFYPDLVIDSHSLSFTMPSDAAVGAAELLLEAHSTMRIDQCDAPAGCTSETRAHETMNVTIVP